MINRKKKTCKGCGKQVYLFSSGYGKCCYYILQKERRKKKIDSGEIPPGGEIAVFMDIWNDREHVSQLSGKKLHMMNVSMFAFRSTNTTLRTFGSSHLRNIICSTTEQKIKERSTQKKTASLGMNCIRNERN